MTNSKSNTSFFEAGVPRNIPTLDHHSVNINHQRPRKDHKRPQKPE